MTAILQRSTLHSHHTMCHACERPLVKEDEIVEMPATKQAARTSELANYLFANHLKLSDHVKLIVFVQEPNCETIRRVLGKYGAGVIENYSQCSFSTKGMARYQEIENGKIGPYTNVTAVGEERIETVVPIELVRKVLEEVKKHHPYKVMGYDIQPLFKLTSKL
jgi:hypothetical protein